MQEDSYNPRNRASVSQRENDQLLLLLAFEYSVFLLASSFFVYGSIAGFLADLLGGLLLFLASPLSIYVIAFAARCRREKTASQYLGLVVILLSLPLVVPLASIAAARFCAASL